MVSMQRIVSTKALGAASLSLGTLVRDKLQHGFRQRAWILLVLVVAIGCKTRPTSLPAELVIPAGARNVSSRTEGGAAGVEFKLKVPFPADDFLTATKSTLEARGWRPLPTDWLNPAIPSSHSRGWTFFYENGTPPVGVHQWLGDWENAAGDIVNYGLQYRSPARDISLKMPVPTNDQLQVTEILMPAVMARATQDQAIRGSGARKP